MPEHKNDTENNAKMDLQVNQRNDLERLNTLDLQKKMCGTKETLANNRQRGVGQAVPGRREKECDKKSTYRTLFGGNKDLRFFF